MSIFSETRGFVVGAASSGTGKTAVASALCRLMRERGLTVQPFKTGPDFIDPTYLTLAAGRTCRNLDGFPCPDLTPFFYRDSCRASGTRADIAVVEGVMGLYDGLGPEGLYSTAWLARTLGLPVILTVDARAAATSVAATVKGFASLEPLAPRLSGVIANRVSGADHAELIREAVMRYAGVPLIGWLPSIKDEGFRSRHLGLVPALEAKDAKAAQDRFTDALRDNLDAEALLSIAQEPSGVLVEPDLPRAVTKADGSPVRAAVADDDAFCFHYRENWELLRRLGAEVVTASPVSDGSLPAGIDLLILPGGYPEEFAGELSSNGRFMKSVADFSRRGCVYAECGGMLYLAESMEYKGAVRKMCGVIPSCVKMTGHLRHFGYVEATAMRDSLIMERGGTIRAHEFHYSAVEGAEPNAFSVRKASRPKENWTDGFVLEDGRLLASYMHVNFYARPEAAERMLLRAAAGNLSQDRSVF
ncbi:MAG: cobyrinate a,c-diamide synthase [Synergistaceae bacterium]|jgi:cobyrinic acid a,c-diamide synthase|nr:cobyrinate a,c-diamide synthase [Synergistaceae bacterium]